VELPPRRRILSNITDGVRSSKRLNLVNLRRFLLITGEDAFEFGPHARVTGSPLLALPRDYAKALTR
jgi:hypothetical protein